jgi:hypothetical protein
VPPRCRYRWQLRKEGVFWDRKGARNAEHKLVAILDVLSLLWCYDELVRCETEHLANLLTMPENLTMTVPHCIVERILEADHDKIRKGNMRCM